MNPLVVPIQPPRYSPYLPPDDIEITPLEDWELGGIALSDGTQGLQVQVWHLYVTGSATTTAVWVEAPSVPPVQLFALNNITWARLAFDQNMHPVISYVDAYGPGFWWYDPVAQGTIFTSLPSTVTTSCLTMDDPRALPPSLGPPDVVMCYVNLGTLCYRLQRERYATEHIWYTNINLLIGNPSVNKIGMNNSLRLQIDIHGALYQ